MAIKILFIALLSIAATAASGCCRGYKILQFRRAGILPVYENPTSCGGIYGHQDDMCDGSIYPTESLPKYDSRYYPSYAEPKSITHKCVCSKTVASQRIMSTVPRYYKRSYCSDPILDAYGSPCGPYGCGQYGDCGQYGQCPQCSDYNQCPHCTQSTHCGMPTTLFRQSAHRVLPLTLPASCVC